jgi:hypothetical protein
MVLTRSVLAAALFCLPGAAHAQVRGSAPPQSSPTEQALVTKLMFEINEALQCSASSIVLQRSLAAAQARVKELEAKHEKPPSVPAPEEPAK